MLLVFVPWPTANGRTWPGAAQTVGKALVINAWKLMNARIKLVNSRFIEEKLFTVPRESCGMTSKFILAVKKTVTSEKIKS